jgi:hypothetical protein
LNLLVLPIFYLLQGCNELSPYWYYRFIQQIIYGLSLCTAIFLGAGLWTLSIASGFVLSWSLFFIWRHYFKFLTFFFSRPVDGRVTWVNEIWPVQWRISISLLTAAFIPLFFTPILFRVSGPVVAGQMGLTISLNSILFALSSNWLATKAPLLGVLVAQNRYRESDALFLASFRASLKVILLGGAALLLGCFMFNITDHPLRWRILPPFPFALLVAATAINSLINNLSIYFRAQKEEPIALTCLLGGLLVVSLSIILGSRFGVTGIACVYLAVLVFLQGPISFLIFFRSRGRRHENNILTGTERIH